MSRRAQPRIVPISGLGWEFASLRASRYGPRIKPIGGLAECWDECVSDIFREIDEELRRDNLLKLWSQYGRYIIAVAVRR